MEELSCLSAQSQRARSNNIRRRPWGRLLMSSALESYVAIPPYYVDLLRRPDDCRAFRANVLDTAVLTGQNRIVEIEGQIRAVIPEEHAELLREFTSAQADLATVSCLEDFISGYRMGVQFMLAAFLDDDGCFKPIGE